MSGRTEILPGVPFRRLDYELYRSRAYCTQLLLWEPTSWAGHVIAAATGGPFCHVSAAVMMQRRLWDVGYLEGAGGVAIPLRQLVKRFPGKCSVFNVAAEYRVWVVRERLIADLGHGYQWAGIRLLGALHLPFVRWCVRTPLVRDRIAAASRSAAERICSRHIAASFAAGGLDFVRKPLALITPNDIGTSGIVRYVGTLFCE